MPASTVAGETLRWAGVAGPANALCSRGPSNAGSVLGTADSANDLELLRNALGVKQISFLGYSYGTRLGTTYGVRHPDRIRAMVLDSPVSADGSIVRFGAGKSVALNNGFLRVGTFCRVQTANDCGVPGGPLAAYDRAMEAQTSVEPGMSWAQIEIAAVAATQRAKDSELPNVARALAALEVGDSSPLLAVSGGQAASGSGLAPTLTSNPDTASSYDDVLVAVNCADSRDRPSGSTVSEAVRAWTGSTPRTARLGGSLAGQCLAWPAAKNPIQARSFAPAGGALIVSAVGDTLTDPKWADDLTSLIVDSQIVRWDGFGHGVSFLRDSACVDDTVTAYLVAPQQQSKVRPSTVCAATSFSTGTQ